MSNYKCPICGKKLTQFKSQFVTGQISCQNNCFENQQFIYHKCPVCNKGLMSKEMYRGSICYIKCDNDLCGFQISPKALITLIMKEHNNNN